MTAYTREELLRDWSAALDRAVEQELGMKFPDRRERIATACMTGMLATGIKGTATDYAVLAVNFADALIAELDKEVQP